jgi:esterase/lipase superfamily enzyme
MCYFNERNIRLNSALREMIMSDYIMTLRDIPASIVPPTTSGTTYLKLDDNDTSLLAGNRAMAGDAWAADIIAQTPRQKDATGVTRGDVLVFIHGYNNTSDLVLQRHRLIKQHLAQCGFLGTVVSFDWPSGDIALAYLPDRLEAKETAFALVRDGIWLVAKGQGAGCDVNVHLLAHSTGAYVVQEAFDDADDHAAISAVNWTVSQIAFISGDISANSMVAGDADTESIYRHCIRLTNYSNAHDQVLQISNLKRIGIEPRVGRVGLPDAAPALALNVDCSTYFESAVAPALAPLDVAGTHSWQFHDMVFASDLAQTLNGDLDRSVITTRTTLVANRFALGNPAVP